MGSQATRHIRLAVVLHGTRLDGLDCRLRYTKAAKCWSL